MSENPYAAPKASVLDGADPADKVKDVAKAQRHLIYAILASLVGNGLMNANAGLGLLVIPLALCIAGFTIWCVFNLCKALVLGPALWIVAMFIPLVNLICLVVLNQKATTYLKGQGVRVGFLGARD
ncbi:hypothetical protein [Mesoterricola silvestris]|uniref:Uncharacterized protein n=1 Tax=Mesoterricola silvestris TaxID=2927979 RepID=A0AA48KAL4_9BACT|nr:hypothetical protein [Mesoterricola silvestris]BDU73432.1 hypothetical protein METEAL_26060 [Mesoterricola silvestris]